MKTDRHHVLKAWTALILWLIVIAIESTTYLSSQNTSRFLYPVLHFLFGIDWASFEPWHAFLRKCGHVFGYGLLSILFFRAWRETLPSPDGSKWSPRWTIIAILGTAIVASLDEWHQSYIPTRTGAVHDVILDTCAGIAAQLALFLYYQRSRKTPASSSEPNSNLT
ncbi:MAG TPA: VanZ family protein [Candidatus Sulfotelmatobacter sp.]|nr:VanZ family protein [Candidatus Sulfotelmatobacter sp.]